MKMKNEIMTLKSKPVGLPKLTDFELIVETIPTIGNGEVLLKSIYISVDPYLRGKMAGTHGAAFETGKPLASKVIAEVVESKNINFKAGEFVSNYLQWKEYQVSDGSGLAKLDDKAAPLSTYLSVLGITGLSAYFALMDIGKPKKGETMVVSGAAGAVGTIVGQIGKIMGCRVVGIAGSDGKVAILKTKFGFDEAINYKTTKDMKVAIAAACPNGVDIYFDNVGGPISDAVLPNLNTYGRVPVCGAISNYNDIETPNSPSILPLVVTKFLSIQGFLIADYAPRFTEGIVQLSKWLKEGKLTYSETIIKGFDKLPEAFIGLFYGINEGKMIVEV
jgi:NADPH-dependent curcumin reductase CurA